jgi:hypothetical protein
VVRTLSPASSFYLFSSSFLVNSGTFVGIERCAALNVSSSSTVKIDRTQLTQNYASNLTDGIGGAVCIGANASVVFSSCKITDNNACISGGAVHIGENNTVSFLQSSGNALKPNSVYAYSSLINYDPMTGKPTLNGTFYNYTYIWSGTGYGHHLYASQGTQLVFQYCQFFILEGNGSSSYMYFNGSLVYHSIYNFALFLYMEGNQ